MGRSTTKFAYSGRDRVRGVGLSAKAGILEGAKKMRNRKKGYRKKTELNSAYAV